MATNGIKEIKISDTNYLIEPALYTITSGSNSDLTADLTNFELFNGVAVNVKFTANAPAGATLNINNTGKKPIYYNGASIVANTLISGNTYTLIYNGTQWEVSGTFSTISASLAQTTKTYLLGTSETLAATAKNVGLIGDNNVYLTASEGELSAVSYSWNVSGVEKAHTEYDATNDCINFVFD